MISRRPSLRGLYCDKPGTGDHEKTKLVSYELDQVGNRRDRASSPSPGQIPTIEYKNLRDHVLSSLAPRKGCLTDKAFGRINRAFSPPRPILSQSGHVEVASAPRPGQIRCPAQFRGCTVPPVVSASATSCGFACRSGPSGPSLADVSRLGWPQDVSCSQVLRRFQTPKGRRSCQTPFLYGPQRW